MSSPAEGQPDLNSTHVEPPATGGWRHRVGIGEWRLLALILLLFLLRDLPWRLEDSGQAEQAFTSLEMVRGGHWWFQHLPGGLRATTAPPLPGWISAVLYYLCAGDWDLAWRVPSLLAGLALVVLLWRAGEQLWPRWGGTVAAGSFALNFLTPRLAMLVSPEMLFGLETTLLGWLIWRRVRVGAPWSLGARWQVFWLLLAALMTAGPIVYAFLWPGMIVYRWISRRQTAQPIPDAWGGWWHWTLPLLPFLFWLERGAITMPGFYQQVIGHPETGRLAPGAIAVAPGQPIYFYALQLLVLWAPWSLLFLGVRLWAYRVWWRLCLEPGGRWLVCWAAGGLVCLSLFPAKPLDRIFPVLPPLCLILTSLLAAARTRPAEAAGAAPRAGEAAWPWTWSRGALWLAGAMTAAATVIQVSLVYQRHANAWADFGAQVRATTAPSRYELVLTAEPTAQDAAMLVYLRRLLYLSPAQAIQLQSTGELDRIVLDRHSPRGARVLFNWFDPARPLLVSGEGGNFALLANAVPAPPRSGTRR